MLTSNHNRSGIKPKESDSKDVESTHYDGSVANK